MDFGNLLGSLGGALSPQQAVPGFAGGMIPTPQLPDAQPIQQALARNQQLGQQRQAQKKPFAENTLGMIMGVIGDALLARNGLNPIYAPQMMQQKQRRQQGQALQNYLGNLDPGLADLVGSGQFDVGTALDLYRFQHPEAKEQPANIREFEYARDRGYKGGYEDWVKLTHPGMMSPLTMGPNDTLEMPGAEAPASSEQTATDANGNKVRYNPQSGQWEPMGGPTAQPSAGFFGQ